MDKYTDHEAGDESIPYVKAQAKGDAIVQGEPIQKASYESNADVQRWLKEQALEDGVKPKFNPTLLASRRDAPWIISSLAHFYEEDLIADVLQVVKTGFFLD